MSYTKISQLAARALKKRVAELEQERRHRYSQWARGNYPGAHIDILTVTNTEVFIARTARKCGHAIVVVPSDSEDKLNIYAVAP